jgi:para-aminobenzoate synthetase component 1
VAIRILLINRGVATFWVGGGIVWDSDPEKEYIETLIKAQAIKEAMIAVC